MACIEKSYNKEIEAASNNPLEMVLKFRLNSFPF